MSNSALNLMNDGLVAVTRDSLAALRSALMRDTGYATAGYLQEAGYAGGGALFESFRSWLSARGEAAPEALAVDAFQENASSFFRECGWGTLTIGDLHDTVVTMDSSDWAEASQNERMEFPCCNFSSGTFADFFGRVADAPIAVLEVECRSVGDNRCRFLLGSVEVMQELYEGMSRGLAYDDAVAAAA